MGIANMGVLAITNGYPLVGLLIPVVLIAAGCLFWFKVKPNYHRRDEGWLKLFGFLFQIEKVINYITLHFITEESLWEVIYGSFGIALLLASIYILYTYILAFLNIELTFLLAFIPFLAIVLAMIIWGVVFYKRHAIPKR